MYNKKDTQGFLKLEILMYLLLSASLIVFVVLAFVNYLDDDNKTQKATSKLLHDISTIETAFVNYKGDFVIPSPPEGFDAYYVSSDKDGYYLCISTTIEHEDDYKRSVLMNVRKKKAHHKVYYNTSCPTKTNMAPCAYPATVFLTHWITKAN